MRRNTACRPSYWLSCLLIRPAVTHPRTCSPAPPSLTRALAHPPRRRQVPGDHAVEVIPDAGHYVQIEQPEAFNATLLRVLAPWLKGGAGAKP
jgi:hypothetical protein